jgi:hypothetical protein
MKTMLVTALITLMLLSVSPSLLAVELSIADSYQTQKFTEAIADTAVGPVAHYEMAATHNLKMTMDPGLYSILGKATEQWPVEANSVLIAIHGQGATVERPIVMTG